MGYVFAEESLVDPTSLRDIADILAGRTKVQIAVHASLCRRIDNHQNEMPSNPTKVENVFDHGSRILNHISHVMRTQMKLPSRRCDDYGQREEKLHLK